MKLWLKQTLVTLAVILLSVSMCLYHFVAQETDQLIQQAIQSGVRDTAVFCDHLSSALKNTIPKARMILPIFFLILFI